MQYKNNIYTIRGNENDNRGDGNDDTSSAQYDDATNAQHASVTQPKNETRLKKHMIAAIVYLALSINVLIVFLLVSNRFTTDSAPAPSGTLTNDIAEKLNDSVADTLAVNVVQPLLGQLKNKTLNVMQFNDWNAQKLKRIDMSWQTLSHDQQIETEQKVWFQLFENALVNELSMLESDGDQAAKSTSDYLALVGLANSLNIRDIPKTLPQTPDRQEITKKASTHLDPIHKSLQKPPQTPDIAREAPIRRPIVQPLIVQPLKKRIARIRPIGPTPSELNDITVNFVDSYEQGNLKKMMSLFSTRAISNRFNSSVAIKTHYANLFKSTSERQIFIQDIKWSYHKGKAVGKGKMATLLMSDTDTAVISRNSRVQIVVEKQGQRARITRFYELVN